MKKLLKHALITSLTNPLSSSIGNYLFGHGIPVFMLHRVRHENHDATEITSRYLRRCLEYLVKHNYTFLSLEDAVLALRNKQTIPPKCVVFTMDDGFADQVEIAAPVFLEFNCPVTIFLITGMLDKKLWPWDDKISYMINTSSKDSININIADEQFHFPLNSNPNRQNARHIIRDIIKAIPANDMDNILDLVAEKTGIRVPDTPPHEFSPMTWDMARECEKKGVKFAPHSVSHRTLSRLDAKTVEHEITVSWQRLKAELASPSPVFCYPTGRFCDYGPREVDILKKMGFIGAVSTIPAQVETNDKADNYYYNLPRFALPSSFDEFIQYVSWLGRVRKDSALFGHY